jgi:hypothetical protein
MRIRRQSRKADVFIKLLEGEFVLLVFLKVIEAEAGEVGNDDVARKVSIFKAGEIVLGLLKGAVNKPAVPIGFVNRLLEGRNAAAGNAKPVKKASQKDLASAWPKNQKPQQWHSCRQRPMIDSLSRSSHRPRSWPRKCLSLRAIYIAASAEPFASPVLRFAAWIGIKHPLNAHLI